MNTSMPWFNKKDFKSKALDVEYYKRTRCHEFANCTLVYRLFRTPLLLLLFLEPVRDPED